MPPTTPDVLGARARPCFGGLCSTGSRNLSGTACAMAVGACVFVAHACVRVCACACVRLGAWPCMFPPHCCPHVCPGAWCTAGRSYKAQHACYAHSAKPGTKPFFNKKQRTMRLRSPGRPSRLLCPAACWASLLTKATACPLLHLAVLRPQVNPIPRRGPVPYARRAHTAKTAQCPRTLHRVCLYPACNSDGNDPPCTSLPNISPPPPLLRAPQLCPAAHLWNATVRSTTCCGSRPATLSLAASANFLKPAWLV